MVEEFATRTTDIIEKLTDTLGHVRDVLKELHERITELENRQDTLWRTLQGLLEHLNKREEVEVGEQPPVRE
jgi:uncharacterized NAD(P)/FAD-binding protein YdhS